MVDGLIRLMESDMPDLAPVNLGNPEEYTILQLAERIIAEVGTSGRIVHQPLPQDDPRRRRPDISRARAMLDWEPRVPLAEGLRQTCAYFAQQLNAAQPATAFPRIAPAVAAE